MSVDLPFSNLAYASPLLRSQCKFLRASGHLAPLSWCTYRQRRTEEKEGPSGQVSNRIESGLGVPF